jgi:hypothetical protein
MYSRASQVLIDIIPMYYIVIHRVVFKSSQVLDTFEVSTYKRE